MVLDRGRWEEGELNEMDSTATSCGCLGGRFFLAAVESCAACTQAPHLSIRYVCTRTASRHQELMVMHELS